jgi:hypothetical protein
MPHLMICAEPDEMQGLHAVAVVQAATAGGEADLAGTAQELLHIALAPKLAELGLRWNPPPEAVERHASKAARPDGPAARLMKTARTRRYARGVLAVAVLVLLWGGYVKGWAWTGFQGNKQLWDWLHLLLLPVTLGTLPLWIQHPEYMSRTRRRAYLATGAAFAALVIAGYLVPLNWTGFPGNTLWDWLELMLLPIAVASVRYLPAVRTLDLELGHMPCHRQRRPVHRYPQPSRDQATVPHRYSEAILAPSAWDRNFAQVTVGTTTSIPAIVPNPQSVPAITLSRPTTWA